MRKVVLALAATAVGLVLLLSFKSHSVSSAPRSALAGVHRTATPSPSLTTSDSHKSAKKKSGKSGTFTGDSISTQYGPMQVAAVVTNGKLTDVTVVQETDGGRSHEIDDASLPILRSEALSVHSADIDVVSGATYTSQGYAQSLQSALDKAGI
jgi:uncharacterized protein with FMN-binding domain